MKTVYKYIKFRESTSDQNGYRRFICNNLKHSFPLGTTCRDPAWRQHVFHPAPKTIFSAECLEDIAHFLKQLNEREK